MAENGKTDNRSATQRIQDLENALMSFYQTLDNMARDLMTVKEALKLLNNKVSSIVQASSKGELVNDEVIDRIMIENNVEELKQRVTNLVGQGVLTSSETVGDNSFVVGSEEDDDGKVVQARIQFALMALQPEVQEKIKGSKGGDLLTLKEGKLKFRVLEVYEIKQPQAQEAAQEAPAPAAN